MGKSNETPRHADSRRGPEHNGGGVSMFDFPSSRPLPAPTNPSLPRPVPSSEVLAWWLAVSWEGGPEEETGRYFCCLMKKKITQPLDVVRLRTQFVKRFGLFLVPGRTRGSKGQVATAPDGPCRMTLGLSLPQEYLLFLLGYISFTAAGSGPTSARRIISVPLLATRARPPSALRSLPSSHPPFPRLLAPLRLMGF